MLDPLPARYVDSHITSKNEKRTVYTLVGELQVKSIHGWLLRIQKPDNYNLRRTLSQGCLERCLVRGQSLDKTSMSTDAEKDSWKERELSKGFEKKRD